MPIFFVEDYVWYGHTIPWMTKPDDLDLMDVPLSSDLVRKVSSFSFGMGAIPNCYLSLVNVDHEWDDQAMVSRSMGRHRTMQSGTKTSPIRTRDDAAATTAGRGAYTVFNVQKFKSRMDQPLVPGQELFLNYEPEYFTSRNFIFGNIPLPKHYRMADTILHRFRNVTNQMKLKSSSPYVTLTTSEDDYNQQQQKYQREKRSQLHQKIKHDLYHTIVDIVATYRSEERRVGKECW